MSLDIVPVDDSPQAAADAYVTTAGQTLNVSAAAGVLSNDFDPDSPNMIVSLAAGPTNGTTTLHADGSLTYLPMDGFIGVDSLTYLVSDGNTTVGPVTVLLEVAVVSAPITGDGNGQDDDDAGSDVDGEGTSGEGVVDGLSPTAPIAPLSTTHAHASASQTSERRSGESKGEPVVTDDEAAVAEIDQKVDDRDFASRLRGHLESAFGHLSSDSDLEGDSQESHIMWENFSLLRQRIQNDEVGQRRIVAATAAASSAATIGYVLWTIRGGFLMATLMTSLPAWRLFDPLPVLAGGNVAGTKDDESLEDIVTKSNNASS